MASNNRRIVYNTRERLLSTDLNDTTALLHAKSTDELVALVTGDKFGSGAPASGVLSGGIVTANGLNLQVSVTPLLALKVGSAATSFDSDYLKIESAAPATIDLSPFVDAGQPRWVAIEVAPGDVAEVVSSRDIFQPALGTFIPTNVDKVRRPEPVFSVNAGTPSGAPQFPTGNPDQLPLAYVYLAASATQVEVLDVILCRPIYQALTQPEAWLQGRGGLDAVEQTPGFQFSINDFSYRPPSAPEQVLRSWSGDAKLFGSDPNFPLGESFPATGRDERVYVYIATPPYPSGYDNDIVGREYIDPSGRLPSAPLGSGFPFLSNGVIVITANAVNSPIPDSPKGIPNAPLTQINDPTWNGGTIDSLAYVGTLVYDDSEQNFKPQRSSRLNDGQVYFTSGSGPGAVGGPADTQIGTGSDTLALNGRLTNFFDVTEGFGPPPHVRDLKVNMTHQSVVGTSSSARVGETALDGADFGTYYRSIVDFGTPFVITEVTEDITLDRLGLFEFEHIATGGTTSLFQFRVRGYLDSILALR